ncbi:MAG: hypothetical protein AB1782_18805 [Cyanobacteriota bacterium]
MVDYITLGNIPKSGSGSNTKLMNRQKEKELNKTEVPQVPNKPEPLNSLTTFQKLDQIVITNHSDNKPENNSNYKIGPDGRKIVQEWQPGKALTFTLP